MPSPLVSGGKPHRQRSSRQRRHQAAHLQGLQAIVPTQVALDAGPLQGLLQGVGGEHAEDHRHARVAGHGGHALAHLRHHHVEVGGVAADHRAEGDHHLIAAAGRQPLGHQGNLEAAGHPGHIQLGAGGGGVDAVAGEAVETAAEQLARHQIVEAGDHDREAEIRRVGEATFEDGQGIQTTK